MNRGMKKHVMKAAACFMVGSLAVSGSSMAALAAGTSLIGIETVQEAEETAKETESVEETEAEDTSDNTTEETTEEAVEETAEEVAQEEVQPQEDLTGTIVMAMLGDDSSYVHIRANADPESDVVGYLYNGYAATVLGQEGEWLLVQSGNCVGYVARYLMTTGDDAMEAIENVGTSVAQVNAEALYVRADASEDAEIIDMVTADQMVYLEEDLGGWAKVSTENGTGYVCADYVSYGTYLPQAETVEESEERIAEEEAAYAAWLEEQERLYQEELARQQAEWEAQNQAWIEYLQSQGQYAEQAEAAVDEAYANQQYLEQVAQDAQNAVYDAYNTGDADAIAQAEAYAEQAAADAEAAAQQTADAQAESYAADQAVIDAAESAGIDTSAIADDGTSSLRQQIVDYALQFVGNPYVYGGTSLTNGTDCSGFTQSVLADNGISVDRTAGQQAQGGTSVDIGDVQPGDLLFYAGDGDYGIGHVSMYIGDGKVVHASSSSTGIIVSDVNYRTPVSAKSYIS
ncbi:MAG: NlpC/P60 family protein [Muricoprocola sp.]